MKACHKLEFLSDKSSSKMAERVWAHAGRPSMSRTDDKVQRVHEVLNSDRRLSVLMIADRIGIDKMTVDDVENLRQIRPEGLDGRPKAEASVYLRRPSVTR